MAAQAAREPAVGALLLAVVSAVSLAVAVIGGGWLPAWYGVTYAAALTLLRASRPPAGA
ncbi:hypothetical protein GCM10022224_095450 [Nonomuraea antimicrobica]|uniref:Uncharacterized protein n=1 Tax=Nonomuraea antimicrobica TaxID=561173 RepID=A0ABP7E894_9ACTN